MSDPGEICRGPAPGDPQPCANGCGRELGRNPRRKGRMCQPCMARTRKRSDAEIQAMRDKLAVTMADPVYRLEHRKACKEAQRRAMKDPRIRAIRKEQGRRVGTLYGHLSITPERNAKVSKAATERYLGWCPIEYREQYKALVRNTGIKAADARAMIEEQIARDFERYQATGQLQASRK